LIAASWIALAVLGTGGLWLAAPDARVHTLLLLPLLVITGLHTLVFAHERYHLPLVPILALYACALVANARAISIWRPRPALMGAIATVVVLLSVWFRQVLFVDAERLRALLDHVA
jgi:hypothetical protein